MDDRGDGAKREAALARCFGRVVGVAQRLLAFSQSIVGDEELAAQNGQLGVERRRATGSDEDRRIGDTTLGRARVVE
jgi:hypothetical protein